MPAFSKLKRHIVGRAPHGEDAQAGHAHHLVDFLHAQRLFLAGDEGRAAGNFVQFQPPLRPGNAQPEAFPRAEGHQRIGEQHAVLVAHQHPHVVLGGDVVAKDVAVADVAGFCFCLQVNGLKFRAFIQAQREGVALGGLYAGVAVIGVVFAALRGVGAPIKRQIPKREHLFGAAVYPKIHQVEVMRGLVHQQPAALVLFAVPPPEVIRAVAHVQCPHKIYLQGCADDAAHDEVAHLGGLGHIAVVEGDDELLAGALGGFQHGAGLRQVCRHGLLADHVAA